MTAKVNRQWCLATRPVGAIAESNFEWKQKPVPALEEGQIRTSQMLNPKSLTENPLNSSQRSQ
jgi:NADPH-dependent curcumin reductase CurA